MSSGLSIISYCVVPEATIISGENCCIHGIIHVATSIKVVQSELSLQLSFSR